MLAFDVPILMQLNRMNTALTLKISIFEQIDGIIASTHTNEKSEANMQRSKGSTVW